MGIQPALPPSCSFCWNQGILIDMTFVFWTRELEGYMLVMPYAGYTTVCVCMCVCVCASCRNLEPASRQTVVTPLYRMKERDS